MGTNRYLIRFDRGGDERFDAVSDDAARDYVIELLHDEGAEEGDGGGLYRLDGGRGEEEYIGEVRLGDDDDGDEPPAPALWRQGWPID